MISQFNAPVTRKRAAFAIAAILVGALLGWGGWTLYGKLTGRPPTVAQVKRSIWKYLGKQCGDHNFNAALDLSAAGVASAPPTTFTNKAGRVKSVVKVSKIGNLGLPETTFSGYFRTNQQAAASYERMYRLIGEQLRVTEQLLDSADAPRQLTALVMASEASAYARTNAENLWLGARICEAYLWPNLPIVEATNQTLFTPDAVLNLCDIAFKDAGETNNIIRNYEYMLARTQRPPQQLDIARFRLAQIYLDAGESAKALKLLKEIKTMKTAKIDRQIAALEKQAPTKKP